MKYLLVVLAFITASCSHEAPTALEGQWKSNKELTISKLKNSEKLTPERIEFLEKNLGEMVIAFKGTKSAIYFAQQEEIEWGNFEVLSSSEKSVTISVTNSVVSSQKVTYFWENGCFYLKQSEWGYNEYFCKMQ